MVTKTDALGALISLTAEQWLGGVVNMKNWTDIWLLEGFMFYLRHTLIDMVHKTFPIIILRIFIGKIKEK